MASAASDQAAAAPGTSERTVLAQDLLSNGSPTDISSRVHVIEPGQAGGNSKGPTNLTVRVPGAVIDEAGTAARSNAKDVSDPGLVLAIKSDDIVDI